MKQWISVFLILASSACSSDSVSTTFDKLEIPKEYVLLAPTTNSNGIYDDDISIALVVSEREIEGSIPQYEIEDRGGEELSLVLYLTPLNLSAISHSAFSDYREDFPETVADKYLPNKRRIYRATDRWLLLYEDGNKKQFVARCRRGLTIAGNIDTCRFKKNINGYGVSYHLENNNISLASEFEQFLCEKIESWKKD